MYYKLKSSGKGFKLMGQVKRIGKANDGYLYLTQEEIDMLSPDAVEGYKVPRDAINIQDELYRNLNKK
jgi:hypothetical protein